MLLAVDVGNTNVKLGVYDDRQLVASWRLTTRREQTADEYGVFTHTMLRSRGLEPARVTDVAISSTVALPRTATSSGLRNRASPCIARRPAASKAAIPSRLAPMMAPAWLPGAGA